MDKLIVLGMDGATFDNLNILIKKGIMPNLSKCVENGVSGTMASTFPPLTGPAWVSMATGKNPGKTGITDFINVSREITKTFTVSSKDYRENGAFWDELNFKGLKTYLIGYPMLFPYYDINGVMIGGWGIPNEEEIAHPKSLINRINSISNGYVNYVPWRTKKEYLSNKDLLINDLSSMLKKQMKVVKELLKDEWNVFFYVCSVCDFIQHAFWDDIKNESSCYHRSILNIWSNIDVLIGDLMEYTSNIFIVSDHGFGPLKNKFLPSKWLKEKGYLKIHSSAGKNIRLNIPATIPKEINLETSLALSHSTGIHGAIIILKREEYIKKKLVSKIIKELQDYANENNFKITIYKSTEIYNGPKVNEVPDILFNVDDYQCDVSSARLNGDTYKKNYDFKMKSGNHREEGIFCAYGLDIKSNIKLKDIKIYDIAPTILHMFNIPISKDIDGRVLKEIFEVDSELHQRKVSFIDTIERDKIINVLKNVKI